MAMKKRWVILATICAIAIAAYVARAPLGREHPCLALLYSFDDGPFAFVHTYETGAAGPFKIGDTKEEVASALSAFPKTRLILTMDEMSDSERQQYYFKENTTVSPDMREFLLRHDQWQVHMTSRGCPALYTVHFEGGRLNRVEVGSWMFAGL